MKSHNNGWGFCAGGPATAKWRRYTYLCRGCALYGGFGGARVGDLGAAARSVERVPRARFKDREGGPEVLNFSQYVELAPAALGVNWREERALRECFGV